MSITTPQLTEETVINAIVQELRKEPLNTACSRVQSLKRIFGTLGITINFELLSAKLWNIYDPDNEDESMLDAIIGWIGK